MNFPIENVEGNLSSSKLNSIICFTFLEFTKIQKTHTIDSNWLQGCPYKGQKIMQITPQYCNMQYESGPCPAL
jgi:hypothetical protein